MSKAHAVLAFYPILYEMGFLSIEEIRNFYTNGTLLVGHPMLPEKGFEFSGGSLGHGVSQGIGCALAARLKKHKFRTYVLVGDGECQEGSIWESAMLAGHLKLNNLTVIIDNNRLQYDGKCEDLLINSNAIAESWKSFGWEVDIINGHSIKELIDVFDTKSMNSDCPHLVIANTIKGNGISFMENQSEWHHGPLSQSQFEIARNEIERFYEK
ncbi:Transketolase [bioreactor metagenome]|uniref:Transketolase n=1 Tax=bioreactor metagenome TaxID=1076179 RepID=A0A645GSQ1_9ZZZZ